MAGRLAILACGGALPVRLAEAFPDAMQITLDGIPSELSGSSQSFQLEKFGAIFESMRDAGITRMVFAGDLTRPPLNPAQFDATMMRLAPGLMQAVGKGDDALLRFVIGVFEAEGFEVVGAHELLPDLTAPAGLHLGPEPSRGDEADITRGLDILDAIAPLDLGQGCAVAGGLCLGIETIQGTDANLRYIATTPEPLKRGQRGVYVKAPKRGQDLRIDMPAIGVRTIEGVANAGLAGLVVAQGQVLVLEPEAVKAAVEQSGIFLISRPV
ncbi:LpxI family protein [Roseovarius sp. ZX-A-9]|uniref:LpxI family protein n=1 Tax=Roseovarius sp. ZX-A-9 TaxID=3014783 RepID=UPI00232B43EC|nr:UDP-2,3-diacylglucosamine diphosphatase LpxI [Roseovarius sp. ZX-A-9]